MYFPFVQFTCDTTSFVINSAATAAYVTNSCDLCTEPIKGTLAMDCDCDPLYWTTDATPDPVVYVSPATDPAPWFAAGLAESADFLGYHVLNVVRPNQVARTVTQRLGRSGGGVLGPLNRSPIRFDFQVLLFACDDLAMEYGYRFLANRLACLNFSTQCDRGSLVYRDSCQDITGSPTQSAVNAGRWRIGNALLINGPVWGDDPIPGMRKHIRRVDFSISGEAVVPDDQPT